MVRVPSELPEPLSKLVVEHGYPAAYSVPSAIGLPADPGVTQEEWDAENAELRAEGERLLDDLAPA